MSGGGGGGAVVVVVVVVVSGDGGGGVHNDQCVTVRDQRSHSGVPVLLCCNADDRTYPQCTSEPTSLAESANVERRLHVIFSECNKHNT
jgi:hypothetical protein